MYQAQVRDLLTSIKYMIESEALAQTALFAEVDFDTMAAILAQAGKLAEESLAPINRTGDMQGSKLVGGSVKTPDGFAEVYKLIADGGWVGLSANPDFGGAGLPLTLQTAVNELFAASCLSLSLCPLLSQGSIDALSKHGSEAQKTAYLPKLISGEWTGAMNLTEPEAGSDVGALRTKAEEIGDGVYRITGQKIWISWGDHDLTDNIVHLVLARLPNAPAGTGGISLFVVPKILPSGEKNALSVVSLEHKMGLHASPTCVMAFEGATAWMVGEPNRGMSAMFTMMNNARLGVGVEGVGVAEAAVQKAVTFALERKQGRTPIGDRHGPIFDHADVRRMLALMKAQTQAARALCLDCALHLDLAEAAATADERAAAAAMGAFLTPLAKAFGTDTGCEVSHQGVQVHGGAGYVEETGAAQFSRDVRVTTIYEGTNGIQALDLVGRKLADGGETASRFIARASREAIALDALQGQHFRVIAQGISDGAAAARRATNWMLNADTVDRGAGAVAYLRLMSVLGGGSYLGRAARLSGDARQGAMAQIFVVSMVRQAAALADLATIGGEAIYALDEATLAP